MLSKVSVSDTFMHYLQNVSSASGALPPDPHRRYAIYRTGKTVDGYLMGYDTSTIQTCLLHHDFI